MYFALRASTQRAFVDCRHCATHLTPYPACHLLDQVQTFSIFTMDFQTPDELFDFFTSDPEQAWSTALGASVRILQCGPAILGSLIHLQIVLPKRVSWQAGRDAFAKAATHTSIVQSFWSSSDEVLMVKAGFDILRSVRSDRGSKSRVHGVEHSEPFASLRRLQTLAIHPQYHITSEHDQQPSLSEEKRLQAQYLQFSLRLNAQDVDLVLRVLDGTSWMDTLHLQPRKNCRQSSYKHF